MASNRSSKLRKGGDSMWLRRNRVLVILAIVAGAIGLVHAAAYFRFIPFLKLEQASVDFRFRLRTNRPGSPKCAIIGINLTSLNPANFAQSEVDKSEALQLMQGQWPWNRKVYALLLDKLMAAGAKTVVFDLLFITKGAGDADLAAALHKYGDRVVIGSVFQSENEDSTSSTQTYSQPVSELLSATNQPIVGCCTIPAELDGVIRENWFYTSELQQYGFPDNSNNIISLAGLGITKFDPTIKLPTGTNFIDYQGPATTYSYFPIEQAFDDQMFKSSAFKDKIVFVGQLTEMFHDSHLTPYGLMPGVEIQAQIAGSMLEGSMLNEAPAWTALLISLGLGLIVAAASIRIVHPIALSGFLAASIFAFAGTAQLMFVWHKLVIPMAEPMLVLIGAGMATLVFNFLLEQVERARVRSVLDRYVSRNVAELILAKSHQFEEALRGQRRHVTVLFSDIRSFTTMTEQAVPEDLVEQLNEYFFGMVEAVLAAEGTLQQFIGDAIMALWGSTHYCDAATGAEQAVRAALDMKAALADLNKEWVGNPARLEFHSGIGINCGEVIVGSIGHPQRMEFTSIGDEINTAARLESATKQFGCSMMVGGTVEAMTRDKFHYRQVGSVKFKGKTKAIDVFTALGTSDSPRPEWLDGYHAAIAEYRSRHFPDARQKFHEVNATLGGKDQLCVMYTEQCLAFEAAPPPPDWDGAWTLTEK